MNRERIARSVVLLALVVGGGYNFLTIDEATGEGKSVDGLTKAQRAAGVASTFGEKPAEPGKPATPSEEGSGAESGAPSSQSTRPARDPASQGPGCLVDAAALEDLRRKKEEIDERSKALAAREADLKAKEMALEEELKKARSLRDEAARISGEAQKEQQEKLDKLVQTLESMSPKSAAQILGSLDERLAVRAMTGITTAKLAKIMNALDPERATSLSEALAGVARAKALKLSASRNAAGTTLAKGGENGDATDRKPDNAGGTGANEHGAVAGREPSSQKTEKPQP